MIKPPKIIENDRTIVNVPVALIYAEKRSALLAVARVGNTVCIGDPAEKINSFSFHSFWAYADSLHQGMVRHDDVSAVFKYSNRIWRIAYHSVSLMALFTPL